MRGYVANADHEWFTRLRPMDASGEVNFWRPGTEAFRAVAPGEPFFCKLKRPHDAIAGFGYFAHFSVLPLTVAWDVFRTGNGARTFEEMRQRVIALRGRFDMTAESKADFPIGCILVNQAVLFAEKEWVRAPDDWAEHVGQGKSYDLTAGEGRRIWTECLARAGSDEGVIRSRLGPRSFRVAVLDAYDRRCAVTGEAALPALDAAHIRDDEQSVNNGILFRADIARLFEAGYVTVGDDLRFRVSRRLSGEYGALDGREIRLPESPAERPLTAALWWHSGERFLG